MAYLLEKVKVADKKNAYGTRIISVTERPAMVQR